MEFKTPCNEIKVSILTDPPYSHIPYYPYHHIPYPYYHYNPPLAMAPQKPSAYQMPGNGKQVSVYDDHSVSNTLGSHIVLLSTCLSELKSKSQW